MARIHSSQISSINLDNSGGTPADEKAETISLDFGVSAETHDTTTIGDTWREATAGLKGGDEFDHQVFYNNTNTTGIWAVLTGRLGVAGTLSFTDGTRTVSMETIITRLGLPIPVGSMLIATARHRITGAVTFS